MAVDVDAGMPRPHIIGHRGAAGQAPENTLAGFETAARYGARWIEFDVRLTGCGRLVVVHDAELHRTTDGAGPVDAFRVDALCELDAGGWFAGAFAGERVPTLEQALDCAARLGLGVNIEAKAEGDAGPATARAVAGPATRSVEHVILSSLDLDALRTWRSLLPDVPRAVVLDDWREDWRALVDELALEALHCHHVWLDAPRVEAVRGAPRAPVLRAYTVNEQDRAAELFALGVEAVFTDYPGPLVAASGAGAGGAPSRTRRRPPAA